MFYDAFCHPSVLLHALNNWRTLEKIFIKFYVGDFGKCPFSFTFDDDDDDDDNNNNNNNKLRQDLRTFLKVGDTC